MHTNILRYPILFKQAIITDNQTKSSVNKLILRKMFSKWYILKKGKHYKVIQDISVNSCFEKFNDKILMSVECSNVKCCSSIRINSIKVAILSDEG